MTRSQTYAVAKIEWLESFFCWQHLFDFFWMLGEKTLHHNLLTRGNNTISLKYHFCYYILGLLLLSYSSILSSCLSLFSYFWLRDNSNLGQWTKRKKIQILAVNSPVTSPPLPNNALLFNPYLLKYLILNKKLFKNHLPKRLVKLT